MYHVRIAKSAKKDIDRIDNRYRHRLETAISLIAYDPYTGKKLNHPSGLRYSYRVGVYRIVYEIYKKDLIVFVIRIGHRQGVYT